MRDFNKIILSGRLGADPVKRETKKGYTVASFPLATSRRVPHEVEDPIHGGSMKEFNEETHWNHIVVWGKDGENCARYLKKGSPILVSGSLRSRKYKDKDENDRYFYEVHAEDVTFLLSGKGREAAGFPLEAVASA